jgi:hypothetical protein
MDRFKKFYRKLRCGVLAFFLTLLVAASLASGQDSSTSQPPTPPPQQQSQSAAAPATKSGSRISPQEGEKLLHDVDEIAAFASADSGLPVKREIKRRLTSRDEVVEYMEKSMAEDKDAQRLRRSELVLKKFGLIPRDFDLQKFLVALLGEQIAGYYDAKTKVVNLLDWVDPEEQRPVLAHELTHALQDQSFGLEKWMKGDDVDLDSKKHLTAEDIETDETSDVRQAVVEGQAMVVLVDYMLAPTGQTLLASPQLAEALKTGMLVGTADSPEFKNAPVFLQEALTFPYRYGLDFEAALLRKGGKEEAFTAVFRNPPRTSRQIMEPETYLSAEQLPPMPVPDFEKEFQNYDRFDVGAIGELDVAVLIDQYAGADVSREMYPHWRGGYYYAVRPKGDATVPLALMYLSRWSDSSTANKFASLYGAALNQRYKHVHEAAPDTGADHHANVDGAHSWLTEEGPVVIEVGGDLVLVTESLDQPTTDKLARELLPAATAPN